jgi:hypothetical protein
MNRKAIFASVAATTATVFMLASQPAQTQTPTPQTPAAAQPAYPDSVVMKTPHGNLNISCSKLGPGRKLTNEFLLQMHPHQDGYTTWMRSKKNDDLQAAAAFIHHLTAHGVEKKEIERVMRACGVSNVQYSTPANDK